MAIGLLLKVGFADGLAPFVDSVFSSENYSSGYANQPAMLAAVSFSIQIFCDFWGYSTMAVGAALLFGIEVPINFYLPYLATSLKDFLATLAYHSLLLVSRLPIFSTGRITARLGYHRS